MAHRILRIVALAALTVALTAAAASASERFASPTGTGSGCTQAQPCNIVTAINDAVTGEDIEIEPGTYGSPTPISTSLSDNSQKLTIHGEAGQPMPVIDTDATAFGIGLSGGSTLSYVDVEDSSNSTDTVGIEVNQLPPIAEETTIDHVISHTTGSGGPTACLPIGTLVDSLCWSSGTDGFGAQVQTAGPDTQSATLVNDTLIGSGSGGRGVFVLATGGFTATLNMTNSIAHGAGADVYVDASGHAVSTVILNASHSSYAEIENANDGGTVIATPAGSGTNQTAAPQFVDAAGGDFHELASSPTIGKGVTSAAAGTTDLAGLPWTSPPDIGAYQFYNAPSCHAASASTKFGTAVSVSLACSDALGDPVTLAIKSGPAHGKLSSISSGGSVTYTPAAGYSGSDSFTYAGTSTLGTSAPATVSITVGPKPVVAPVISHAKQSKGVFTFTLNEPATVTLTFARRGHKSVTVKIKGRAGKNSYKARRLKAGAYVVTITARNASGHSKSVKVKYKLAARR